MKKKKRKINFKRMLTVIVIFGAIFYGISIYLKENLKKVEAVLPSEVYGAKVHTKLIDSGTEARPGKKRKIKYLVIHETDNTANGADAENHAEFLSKNNKTSTSWHYTVDDKEIYHHIPDDEVAHHAATDKGNLYGIGIELCVNEDGKFEKTFENGTKLVAYLLKEYNLNINDIKTHNDFSGKDCPHNILKANRMEEFKNKVKIYLKAE